MIWKKRFAIALILIPFYLLVNHLGDFVYPLGSPYSDLTITHYPNLVFIKNSILHWGQIPLWSDLILGGYPFFANPLSSLWYPPGWLLLLMPSPFGFNFLVIGHLVLGGAGVYLFLRQQGINELGSLVGGITFELMPKIFAHFGAGHITLIFAVCWTPWLLWAEARSKQFSWRGGSLVRMVLLGLIFLADLRWGAYATLVWLAFSLYLLLQRKPAPGAKSTWKDRLYDIFLWLGSNLLQILIAVCIASPLLIPLVQYTALSTRASMTVGDNLAFSIPPLRLLGLIFPDFAGYAEWMVYPGAFGLLSVCWVLCSKRLWKIGGFWIWVFFISIVYSLGSNFPGISWLAGLPGFNLLRVPSRAYFLGGFSIAILSGFVFQEFQKFSVEVASKQRSGPGLLVAAIAGFADLLAVGVFIINKTLPLEFLWGALTLTCFGVLMILRQREILSIQAWGVILFPLLLLDLGGVSYGQIQFRTAVDVRSEGSEIALWLQNQAGIFRIYTPSYSISQSTAAAYQIQQANGIDPLQVRAYVDYMRKATGIGLEGYQVTVPAFMGEDIYHANQTAVVDLQRLSMLNVRFLVANFPMDEPGLLLRYTAGETRIYENSSVYPRAWMQNGPADIRTADFNAISSVIFSPNVIQIQANGKGLLVLSEINYPGWKAFIDGMETKIIPVAGILRGVNLPPGNHKIEFEFVPGSLIIGLVLGVIGWSFTLTLWFMRKKVPFRW
jgi:hypothetical protein